MDCGEDLIVRILLENRDLNVSRWGWGRELALGTGGIERLWRDEDVMGLSSTRYSFSFQDQLSRS